MQNKLSSDTGSRRALPLLLIGMLVIGNIVLFAALWLSTPESSSSLIDKQISEPSALADQKLAVIDSNLMPDALTRLEQEKKATVLLQQAMQNCNSAVQGLLSIQKKTQYLQESRKLFTLSGDAYYIKQQQQLNQDITQLQTRMEPLLTQYVHELKTFCKIPEGIRDTALRVVTYTYTKSNSVEQAIFRQLHQDTQACSNASNINPEQIRTRIELYYQKLTNPHPKKENL